MVTPSLVIIGEPNFLSITTLRPRGPSVTLTESASLLTPRSRARRASVLNARFLAAMSSFRTTALPGGALLVEQGRAGPSGPRRSFLVERRNPPRPPRG